MVVYGFYKTDARVMRYAEALVQRGDQVDVLVLSRPGMPRQEVIRGVNAIRIQERVRNEHTRATFVFRFGLFFLRAMILLSMKHIRNPYQLIHVHSVPDSLVFVAWLPKLMGCKIILDIHDLLPEFYASKFGIAPGSLTFRFLQFVEKVSAGFSDHVIISNHIWEERLVARSVGKGKTTAVINYPDRSIFRLGDRNSKPDKFVILYPGTLNWHQGLDVAIRALALIKESVPEAEFHIYGEGPAKNHLVELADELGLGDRVFFKDFLPVREIGKVMQSADLGVVPKRNDSFGNEAFSTKILEFMSVGVPVLISDTKIDRYYFNESIVKFFRSNNERDLADSLLSLVRDKELRERLARNALEFVRGNDWDSNKWKYFEIVDRLCQSRQGSTV